MRATGYRRLPPHALEGMARRVPQPYKGQVGNTAVVAVRSAGNHEGYMGKIFYNVPEVACALGIGRTTVYELMKSGELKSAKIGDRRVISVASVQSFAQSVLDAA